MGIFQGAISVLTPIPARRRPVTESCDASACVCAGPAVQTPEVPHLVANDGQELAVLEVRRRSHLDWRVRLSQS